MQMRMEIAPRILQSQGEPAGFWVSEKGVGGFRGRPGVITVTRVH